MSEATSALSFNKEYSNDKFVYRSIFPLSEEMKYLEVSFEPIKGDVLESLNAIMKKTSVSTPPKKRKSPDSDDEKLNPQTRYDKSKS